MQQTHQRYAESPEFLPIKNGQRVGSYHNSLSLLYIDPKLVHLARDRWKVDEIKTYKDRGAKQKHEDLVATLNDGDGGKVLLRIERRIQNSSAKAFEKAKQDVAQPNDEKERFFKIITDEVSLVSSNFNKQLFVEHVAFDDKSRVSLPQLIVLACAITRGTLL